MSKDFFAFCYDQYKLEHAEADKFYSKAGILISAMTVLGSCIYRLSEPASFLNWGFTLSTGQNVVTILTVIVLLKVLWHTFQMLRPRKEYEDLASAKLWHEWRQDQARVIAMETIPQAGELELEDTVNEAFFAEIAPKLAKAQETNAKINERRRKHFREAILWMSKAVFGLLIQASLQLALYFQNLHLHGANH